MRILYFDMEFANGQVPGSIYSIGYTVTDEEFNVLTPPVDLCINPECEWNEYVEQNILAYPKEEIAAAPTFSDRYGEICELFKTCDMAVGFAVSNDVKALRRACERYALPHIPYHRFDVEKLARMQPEHKEAHGLGGYFEAWCGDEVENRHRSDGDAYATMLLLKSICRHLHVTADMLFEAYPECVGEVLAVQPPKQPKPPKTTQKKSVKRPRRRKKSKGTNASATEQNIKNDKI